MRLTALAAVAIVAVACATVERAPDRAPSACTPCHGEAVAAQRRAPFVHGPFADDACAQCHGEHPAAGGAAGLLAPERQVCTNCHDDLPLSRGVVHGAIVAGGCRGCHAPHSAAQPNLLRVAPGALCARCHPAERVRAAHAGHTPPPERCGRCHATHGGSREKLLGDVVHPVLSECGLCHAAPGAGAPLARLSAEPALCAACHEGPATPRSPGARDRHPAPGGGKAPCTSCHDPHTAAEPSLLTTRPAALCGGCHPRIVERLSARTLHQPAREGCATCHSVHSGRGEPLLVAPAPALCGRCHGEAPRWRGSRSVHPPARDGRCAVCHDPHGTDAPHLVRTAAPAGCTGCHPAAKLHGHAGADCSRCHGPHASDREALLVGPPESRCAGCHEQVLADHPAGKRHAPFAQGACLRCHEVHGAGVKLVKEPQGKTCLECHAAVRRTEEAGGSGHAPFLAGACAFCHDPHGSARPRLLRQEPALLCLSCHTALRGQIARAARLHDPVRAGACLECHRQHTAPGPKLLTASPPALCGSCHHLGGERLEAAHRGLAVGDASCVSCHDPHVVREARRVPRDVP